jgi:hypothetical protein
MEHNGTAPIPSDAEAERGLMQDLLDREFPGGAMAALVRRDGGRIEPGRTCATGRLICERSELDGAGTWWFSIVIDPRRSRKEQPDALRLWVSAPHRCDDSTNLWEARVRTGDDAISVLRLNASPPAQWRPTQEMRCAVTEAYADFLEAPIGAR